MRLLVISHTAHFLQAGRLFGWSPTVREIDALAQACDSVTHLASLHPGPPPASAQAYTSGRVEFIPVPPAGGAQLRARLAVFLAVPAYLRALRLGLAQADFVQVRAPHALALTAMLLLAFYPEKPRWYKYAGDWSGKSGDTLAFRAQRAWLRSGLGRGPVAVNGRWADQPAQVFSIDNPSFSLEEAAKVRQMASGKRLSRPLRLVFAGRLEPAKGAGLALQIVKILSSREIIRLDVLGDGPERAALLALAQALGVETQVHFHGWGSQEKVRECLAQAHFALLPSRSEGWPKFLSEAMACGAVPIAAPVGAIPQVLAETGAGLCPPLEAAAWADVLASLARDPARWEQLSRAGIASAPRFSYQCYLVSLEEMWTGYAGVSPFDPTWLSTARRRLAAAPAEWQAGRPG